MDMNTIAFEFDDIDAFHTVINTLKGGTTYYWRVQSKDPQGVYSAHTKVSRFTTAGVTAVDDELVIPQRFALEQNYPNPFNPSTIIRFSLPEASFVILKIYNVLGQEVKTLVNAEKNAGIYNLQWRGDNDFGQKVSSGTYIYRVITGHNIFTKKMILLR
ncbi:MAG: T9SS type A sorting domain-containing protein [Bacteroidetes bacterium]|nr:T9SS type A sorting domain-containing protein [Bacteroidota bacterium]